MKKRNEQTIRNAFARLKADKDEIIRAGMYGLLENAVQSALAAHDISHQSHITLGDTYGWMLVHNHRIEEISVVSTADNRGNATKMLRSKLKDLPAKGWVGVVMAGLKPANYFLVEYEENMLNYAKNVTWTNFSQYFKPLQ